MKLILIAALDRDRVIGKGGAIPWDLSGDRARFRRLTMGHAVLMGRRTYESLPSHLDGRRMVVLSRTPIEGMESYRSLAEARHVLSEEEIVFVIGGEQLYRQTIAVADGWELTLVEGKHEGDAHFPPYEHFIGSAFRLQGEEAGNGCRFLTYERISPAPQV